MSNVWFDLTCIRRYMCVVNENLKTAVLGQACPTVQWHQEGMVVGLAMLTYVHGAGLKDDVFRPFVSKLNRCYDLNTARHGG